MHFLIFYKKIGFYLKYKYFDKILLFIQSIFI